MTTLAPFPTQNPWLHPLPDNHAPPVSERLIRALEAQVAAEADDVARCERFAQATGNRAAHMLLELIVEDGQRHQTILRRMMARLREEVEFTESSTALPVPSEDALPEYSGESMALLRSLIRDEQEGARYLRHLARQQSDMYDGLFTLLLHTLARDNEKHVHLLRYLLRRLEAA